MAVRSNGFSVAAAMILAASCLNVAAQAPADLAKIKEIGKGFYIISANGKMYRHDFSDPGKAIDLGAGNKGFVDPTGKYIAYQKLDQAKTGDEVWIMNSDGTNNHKLYGPLDHVTTLKWTNKGTIIFTADPKPIATWGGSGTVVELDLTGKLHQIWKSTELVNDIDRHENKLVYRYGASDGYVADIVNESSISGAKKIAQGCNFQFSPDGTKLTINAVGHASMKVIKVSDYSTVKTVQTQSIVGSPVRNFIWSGVDPWMVCVSNDGNKPSDNWALNYTTGQMVRLGWTNSKEPWGSMFVGEAGSTLVSRDADFALVHATGSAKQNVMSVNMTGRTVLRAQDAKAIISIFAKSAAGRIERLLPVSR